MRDKSPCCRASDSSIEHHHKVGQYTLLRRSRSGEIRRKKVKKSDFYSLFNEKMDEKELTNVVISNDTEGFTQEDYLHIPGYATVMEEYT